MLYKKILLDIWSPTICPTTSFMQCIIQKYFGLLLCWNDFICFIICWHLCCCRTATPMHLVHYIGVWPLQSFHIHVAFFVGNGSCIFPGRSVNISVLPLTLTPIAVCPKIYCKCWALQLHRHSLIPVHIDMAI